MSLIKIIKKVGGQKKYGVELEDKPILDSVARFINSKGEVEGFANMKLDSQKTIIEVNPKQYDVEPMIPAGKQNIAVLISGGSDTGKSTMGSILTWQYSQLYPNRPMYYISQKRKERDINFSKIKELQQWDNEQIENFKLNDHEDCLFVIDDFDEGEEKKDKKNVMKMLNLISMVGREQRISWIYISHNNSRLNETNAFSEWQIYITYQDNLINNQMLFQNMGLTKNQIEKIKSLNSTYYVFNKIFKCLITEDGVRKY